MSKQSVFIEIPNNNKEDYHDEFEKLDNGRTCVIDCVNMHTKKCLECKYVLIEESKNTGRRRYWCGWEGYQTYVYRDQKKYDQKPKNYKIREMLGNKCSDCGWDKGFCHVHHIIPKSAGGTDELENLIVLCPNCHQIRHNEMRGKKAI